MNPELKFNQPPMIFKTLFNKKTNLHFIHIGKTGGSNIKSTLKNVKTDHFNLIFHLHTFRLNDIPVGDKYFFSVRDPLARFQSGFYSRKRKGKPRYSFEWSPEEAKAFSLFSGPNELAEALNPTDKNYENAVFAMKSIAHVNTSYWDWFENKQYFEERIPDLFCILRLENLNTDFDGFLKKINSKENLQLATDPVSMHSNNQEYYLSEKARENLNVWYKKEYEFINLVENYIR